MKLFVKLNERLDKYLSTRKKVGLMEWLFYLTFGSVVVCSYKKLLPEFWLCVLFFSVLGFWVAFSAIRVSWLFYQRHQILNKPFN